VTVRRLRSSRGQASVELLAILPLLFLVAGAAFQALAAGAARELAGHAAEAAAVAILQDESPRAAARAAVPGWSRSRLAVRVRGRRVRVRLRPPAPTRSIGRLLTAEAFASAGGRR
jgi:Flp pilus assembly protein TadG